MAADQASALELALELGEAVGYIDSDGFLRLQQPVSGIPVTVNMTFRTYTGVQYENNYPHQFRVLFGPQATAFDPASVFAHSEILSTQGTVQGVNEIVTTTVNVPSDQIEAKGFRFYIQPIEDTYILPTLSGIVAAYSGGATAANVPVGTTSLNLNSTSDYQFDPKRMGLFSNFRNTASAAWIVDQNGGMFSVPSLVNFPQSGTPPFGTTVPSGQTVRTSPANFNLRVVENKAVGIRGYLADRTTPFSVQTATLPPAAQMTHGQQFDLPEVLNTFEPVFFVSFQCDVNVGADDTYAPWDVWFIINGVQTEQWIYQDQWLSAGYPSYTCWSQQYKQSDLNGANVGTDVFGEMTYSISLAADEYGVYLPAMYF
jgi:hypothetical protein